MIKNNLSIDFIQDDIFLTKCFKRIHGDQNTTKLVSCLFGSFQLIVVNNDPNSNQFKQWESFELTFKTDIKF